MKNQIISELRRTRDARARRHNFDLAAMARDLMELDPVMESKTYLRQNGMMVSVASLRKGKLRRPPATSK